MQFSALRRTARILGVALREANWTPRPKTEEYILAGAKTCLQFFAPQTRHRGGKNRVEGILTRIVRDCNLHFEAAGAVAGVTDGGVGVEDADVQV
jgi:hypothetical protein